MNIQPLRFRFHSATIAMLVAEASCGLVCVGNAQELDELPVPIPALTAEDIVFGGSPAEPSDAALATIDEQGVETLVRGPLHEAFAEPIMADPTPGFVVNLEPPNEINELPPDYRPDGDRAIWISGYWGWDDQREDYIWISGVYRIPPDGHRWVPGYWLAVDEGWQWVQGFWVSDIVESLEYLPAPPSSLEVGPSSPAPSSDYFYVPGSWSESTSDSLWSPGYWHPIQEDFIWIPSHAVWTPRGCIYIPGYWDRRLPLRGLCFAPVYIPRSTYSIASWSWQPSVVLNSQIVLHNLFVQPRYGHYVFGDYYGLPISNGRTIPAYIYHQRRGQFDPLISFYTAYNARQGHDLIGWYGNQFSDLNRNPAKRPPHVFHAAHASGSGQFRQNNELHSDFAQSLSVLAKNENGPRISRVAPGIQDEMRTRDVERKQLVNDRRTLERQTTLTARTQPNDRGNRGVELGNGISLKLPALSKSERGSANPMERSFKRPEPPRNAAIDRPNSRPAELPRQLGTNQPKGTTQPNGQLGNSPSERFRPSNLLNQSELLRQSDRGQGDRGQPNRGQLDRGQSDRGPSDRGPSGRGPSGRESNRVPPTNVAPPNTSPLRIPNIQNPLVPPTNPTNPIRPAAGTRPGNGTPNNNSGTARQTETRTKPPIQPPIIPRVTDPIRNALGTPGTPGTIRTPANTPEPVLRSKPSQLGQPPTKPPSEGIKPPSGSGIRNGGQGNGNSEGNRGGRAPASGGNSGRDRSERDRKGK